MVYYSIEGYWRRLTSVDLERMITSVQTMHVTLKHLFMSISPGKNAYNPHTTQVRKLQALKRNGTQILLDLKSRSKVKGYDRYNLEILSGYVKLLPKG